MNHKKFISVSLLVVLILLFLYSFLSRIWVAEDAYITFRHIQNFLNNYGLTFNINERIEGFTHPLWVIFLIILAKLDFSLHFGSLLLGCFFTILGMGLLIYHFIIKIYKWDYYNKTILIIPIFFIIHDGFRSFWTSGLEFSLTFFLISLFLILNANKELTKPEYNAIIFAFLYLTRPELGILFVYYGIYYFIIHIKRKNFFNLFIIVLKFTTPFILITGLYHLFRWFYYHELFPNTFYAKSSEILWKEGLLYLWHTIFYSPLLLPMIFLLIIYKIFLKYKNRYFLRDLGAILLHVLYLISIGGDFMAYRLLLPDLVILYVYLYIITNELQSKIFNKHSYVFYINIILVIVSFIYLFQLKYHTPVAKYLIVDEYRAYLNKNQNWQERWFTINHKWYDRGLIFKELQKCLQYEPFIITNSWLDAKCAPLDDYGLGYFGYAANSKVIIIDQLGITDKEVAKTGKTIWKRVGHLKSISTENVLKRKVLFCNLQHQEYDQIMMTNFFPIISLDKEFLFRLGSQYNEKIPKLKKLYKKIQYSKDQRDQQLLSYLNLMQSTYKTSIIDLPDSIPDTYKKYDLCWQIKMNDVDPYQHIKNQYKIPH
jgi:arabinofuranosyltransferase